MDATNQTETAQPTPEQLLKLLDVQLAGARGKRAGKSRNRATFLVAGILFIIAATGIALFVAGQLLAELQERGALRPSASQTEDSR